MFEFLHPSLFCRLTKTAYTFIGFKGLNFVLIVSNDSISMAQSSLQDRSPIMCPVYSVE